MVRKVLVVFLVVLLLLTSALLAACETAGSPLPTATPKPVIAKPATPLPTPLPGEYPTPPEGINAYP